MSLQRFEELKAKGYVNLKEDTGERAEYRDLKAKYGDNIVEAYKKEMTEPEVEQPLAEQLGLNDSSKGTAGDKIVLSKAELQQLIAEEIAKVPQAQMVDGELPIGQWRTADKPKELERFATLRIYRADSEAAPALIMGMKFHKNEYDENTRRYDRPTYKVNLRYDTGELKEIMLPLEEFAKMNEYEKVEIIKQKQIPKELIAGYVGRPEVKNGATMSEGRRSSERIPLVVKAVDILCTIKRPNGEELEVDSLKLNQ